MSGRPAESVLRAELVASHRFLEILTVRAVRTWNAPGQRSSSTSVSWKFHPDGLGLTLDGFTLHDLHPPTEVVNSYHTVAKAIQEPRQGG